MNVLFISSGNKNGGKQSNLVLAQGDSLSNEGIKIFNFPIIGKGAIGYISNIRKIKRAIEKNQIDIVHAHYGYCGLISFFAKKKAKLVVSLMGSDLIGDIGGTIISRSFDKSIGLITKIFARYFFDSTIVKSESMLDYLFRGKKYYVIPNGIDFSTFYPIDKKEARKELNIVTEVQIVLFAADPNRVEKNYSLAQKAISILNNNNIQLLTIHGLSQKELNLYYNASDVCLLTSLYEGSPNVIKENLACNRVIVSQNVGDVERNFKEVNNCFLTSYDPHDVAEKISLALTKKESNGRVRISHLNSEIIAKKIIDIYNSL